jgi:predicted metal-dependent phosphoesterase TrpH
MVDLHIHSRNSIGLLPIDDIIKKAIDFGLKIISITDYDFLFDAEQYIRNDIILVSGVELYCRDRDDIKIIGYNIKEPIAVKCYCDKVNILRKRFFYFAFRNIKDEYLKNLLKNDFKRFLLENENKQISKMFLEYRQSYLSSAEIIKLIHISDGIAVLANPSGITDMSYKEAIRYFKKQGVDGIECFHPSILNNEEMIAEAKKYGLKISGGSVSKTDYEKIGYVNGNILKPNELTILDCFIGKI